MGAETLRLNMTTQKTLGANVYHATKVAATTRNCNTEWHVTIATAEAPLWRDVYRCSNYWTDQAARPRPRQTSSGLLHARIRTPNKTCE